MGRHVMRDAPIYLSGLAQAVTSNGGRAPTRRATVKGARAL
jgi:hypothetical protein